MRIGPYLVEDALGRGGMGTVYRARHVETGATHALKVIRLPEESMGSPIAARFAREAEALARVGDHPGIATVHATGSGPGMVWLAMDLIEGESLARVLARRGALPPREAAEIVAAIVRAVEHVHAPGVLHRDIKPENVILDVDGRPHLVDFGLAYDPLDTSITRSGQLVGTPAYMAPEQTSREAGGGALGPTTDVYGLGALLWACLAGRPPFQGLPTPQLLVAVLRQSPGSPSAAAGAPASSLDAVCAKAMAKAPAERHRTSRALLAELDAFLAGRAPNAESAAPRRVRWAATAAAVTVLTVAIGIAWMSLRGSSARESPAPVSDADWHGAIDRLRVGELSALDEAVTAAALAGDDPAWSERRALLRDLLALRAGDAVAIRTVAVDRAPWTDHHELLVAVLLAADRPEDLDRLAERSSALGADPAVLDGVERASGRAWDDDAVAALLSLVARAEGTAPIRRIDAVRFRLLAGWIERRLAAGCTWRELRPSWRRELIRALRVDERLTLDLGPAIDKLVAIICDRDTSPEERLAAGEVTLAGLSSESVDVSDELALETSNQLLAAVIDGETERAFELICLARRGRTWPDNSGIAQAAHATTKYTDGQLAEEWRHPPERRSPTRIAALLAAAIANRIDALESATAPHLVRRTFGLARVEAVTQCWPDVERLLDLDALEPDGRLPGWILTWLGVLIAEIDRGAVSGLGGPTEGRDALLAMFCDALEARPSLRGPSATSGGARRGDDRSEERRQTLIAELLEEAYRRARKVDERWRLAQIPLALVSPDARFARDRVAALRDAIAWTAARTQLYQMTTVRATSPHLDKLEAVVDQTVWHLLHDRRREHTMEACELCDQTRELVDAFDRVRPGTTVPIRASAVSSWTHGRYEEGVGSLADHPKDEQLAAVLLFGCWTFRGAGKPDQARALAERSLQIEAISSRRCLERASFWTSIGEHDRAQADEDRGEQLRQEEEAQRRTGGRR